MCIEVKYMFTEVSVILHWSEFLWWVLHHVEAQNGVARWATSKRRRFFLILLSHVGSRGSSGSIVSDYGLDDRGSIPGRGKGFFF
jgi:hypothetical protein